MPGACPAPVCPKPSAPAELLDRPPRPSLLVPGYYGDNASAVTQRDVLAAHADEVAYCRGVEAQRDKLQEFVRGWMQ